MDKNLFKKAAEAEGMDHEAQESDQVEASEGEDPERDPAYRKALEMMLSKLFEEGAAEGLGKALAAAPDKVQGIVDQTISLLDVMEQATQGSVPDELVMPFVLEATQQVVEIGQAAGTKITNAEIAAAIREILAQVMENLGADTSQLREEMGQVDPEEVGRMAEAQQ